MRSTLRLAAGVVIALFALTSAFGLPFSFVSEYGGFGSGPGADVSGYVLVIVVAGPVLALGVWLMFRRGWWALVGGLVLSVAAALTGGGLGQTAHDRAQQARAGACSPDERSEFQALGAIQTNGEYGTGDSDGSCRASFGGRTPSSLDQLRQVIEGRGWKPDDAETYARDGKRLRIEVTEEDDDKGLNIILRFP